MIDEFYALTIFGCVWHARRPSVAPQRVGRLGQTLARQERVWVVKIAQGHVDSGPAGIELGEGRYLAICDGSDSRHGLLAYWAGSSPINGIEVPRSPYQTDNMGWRGSTHVLAALFLDRQEALHYAGKHYSRFTDALLPYTNAVLAEIGKQRDPHFCVEDGVWKLPGVVYRPPIAEPAWFSKVGVESGK